MSDGSSQMNASPFWFTSSPVAEANGPSLCVVLSAIDDKGFVDRDFAVRGVEGK